MRRLFISDLHLQPERPEIRQALLYFLETVAPGCDELYLLGDIFEAWIGDDWDDPFFEPVYQQLAQLNAQGTEILFQHGNRDFLLGTEGARRLSATLLPEAHLIDLPQGRALVMHGDQLCTDDVEYQRLRAQVRSSEWQKAVLSQPIEARLAQARQLRDASAAANASKSMQIMDVSPETVSAVMEQYNVDLLIHGHTHRPKIHQQQRTANSGVRVVLGDWHANGWYLISDPKSFHLANFFPVDPEHRTLTYRKDSKC